MFRCRQSRFLRWRQDICTTQCDIFNCCLPHRTAIGKSFQKNSTHIQQGSVSWSYTESAGYRREGNAGAVPSPSFSWFARGWGATRALHVSSKHSVAELHVQPFLLFSDTDSSNFGSWNSIALSSWGQFLRSKPASLGDWFLPELILEKNLKGRERRERG